MDVLSAEGIRHRAGTRTIGRLLEVHEELPSTNAAALQRAGDAAHHGLVVFAEHQSAGRGRLNRAWHSPRGASILCSAVLFLDCRSVAGRGLPLWSAMAVRDALWESCNVNALIKWPNDLVVGNKKISGILIEARQLDHSRWSYVVGVGINCLQHRGHFPTELQSRATSLDLESAEPVDRLQVAVELLRALDRRYHETFESTARALRLEWLSHSLPLGRRLRVHAQGQSCIGRLVDLDPEGGILVELEHGGRRLFSPYVTTIESLDG